MTIIPHIVVGILSIYFICIVWFYYELFLKKEKDNKKRNEFKIDDDIL